MARTTAGGGYDRAKRALDAVLATGGLVLAAPLAGAVALAVRRDVGAPVLFRQQRPGRDGRPFELVKFRTMRAPDASRGRNSDGDRLTALGRWLRATSLDEIPTLWNVVRGDMSLVGPRPLLMHYLEHYTPEQARRHEVRPGVTGLAQTSGRNALSWDEKFAYDVTYVDTRSLLVDARILARTAMAVVTRRGISAAGDATMPEFRSAETARLAEVTS